MKRELYICDSNNIITVCYDLLPAAEECRIDL